MPISKYLLNAREQLETEMRVRNKWMIRVRWYYMLLLPGVAIIPTLLIATDKSPIKKYIIVALAGLAVNGLLWTATLPKRWGLEYYRAIAFFQVLLDMGLASYVIYSQKGFYSRATLLYAVPILAGGLLFQRGFSYLVAALSSLAYTATLLLYASHHPHEYLLRDALVPMLFYSCVFFVLAAIVSYYSRINAMDERQKSYIELVAMLRHQLHQPTGVIAALVEMLEHGESYNKLSPKEKEFIRQLKHENHRLNSMIANLLEAVHDIEEKPVRADEPINLIQLIEETANRCAASARRSKDLKINYPIKAFVIAGQPQQVAIAFENIIDNAFRYSPDDSPIQIDIQQDGPWIKVSVKDEGEGISTKQRKQLFRRFTKFEEGTNEDTAQLYSMGLGLYVSKVIIERHEGKLEVEAASGKGTKVIVRL